MQTFVCVSVCVCISCFSCEKIYGPHQIVKGVFDPKDQINYLSGILGLKSLKFVLEGLHPGYR